MKFIVLYIFILMTLFSCGEKKESGKASFKLLLGGSTSALIINEYPGGLLLLGRRIDGGQSFSLRFTEGLELDLQKGIWEFATIGWYELGFNGVMQGKQRCSFKRIELTQDIQSISFEMSADACLTLRTSENETLSDSQFMNLDDASGKLNMLEVGRCNSTSVTSCVTSVGNVQSVRISIPVDLEGLNISNAVELSECINLSTGGSAKKLTLPLGGVNGFIGTIVETYDSLTCLSGTKISRYEFPNGLAGDSISTKVILSPNGNFGIAPKEFNYKGTWNIANAFPVNPIKGDVYKATVNLSILSTIKQNNFFVFNETWENLNSSTGYSVGPNNKVYFNGAHAILFLLDEN